MKETRLISRFSEKILIWGNGSFWGFKIAHPHNSGSAGRSFFRFFTMKRANRYVRMIIIFQKKFVWGKWSILDPKIAHFHNSASAVKIIFRFCTMKRVIR